ncbi:hypothetical protein EMIHUDRAFT_232862 [Emiliania huxleyi CCMP1516]|uniref:RING-type domain-containing protein n=2 Tax=Emiliania huxleyi TaxID=2903 RepID=A0A0D3K419_EMIH1|nr:hypothetical protein EMIHUDRAFT_232862 [Emiliania huxleyi CCMP1516]EOD30504.1 hypothetical protein EMIHUDRAFT_232862 [Emiliania huxleyi CCMP1516]|eukprot:XP_005782933.1 hypothetical protein EMIHUDRAFT_232862 [Emiliania huxleyi CCMP1516]
MGDFGPAYAYAQQDPGLVCQECHAGPLRLPRSGTCPHCGTSLRGAAPAGSRGGGGGSGPDMETATLETMVPALLQRIVAPGLLEGLADYGDASAAADETAIESLETVKVEPHVRNASELSGAVVLAWRGGCSFVDKVRRVQQAGAAACLVVQTGDKWPLSMSDSASAGSDITLPSAMLKPADGETSARGAELVASTLAVRLPCRHTFHEECLRAWLSKHNTCPTCRAKLPTTAEVAAAEEEREGGPPPPSQGRRVGGVAFRGPEVA